VIELRKRGEEVREGLIESIAAAFGAGAVVDRQYGRRRRSVETGVPAQPMCDLVADLTAH